MFVGEEILKSSGSQALGTIPSPPEGWAKAPSPPHLSSPGLPTLTVHSSFIVR